MKIRKFENEKLFKTYDLRLTTILLFIVLYSLFTAHCFSQSSGVGVNTTGAEADNSAMLDISTTGKGLLLPRMTTAQRPASPLESLLIYNTDTQCFEAYNSVTKQWVNLACIGSGFKCGNNLIDSRDSKSYKTVQIGTQCWMKENINIGIMIDSMSQQINNAIIEKHCYRNDVNNCNIYGGLYQWNETMQYVTTAKTQGICPAGWHVPDDADWTILSDFLGGLTVAGSKLKESGTDHWCSPNSDASNSSGFTAIGAGDRFIQDNAFYGINEQGFWWTSAEEPTSPGDARDIYMNCYFGNVVQNYDNKGFSFSERCLRD